MAQDTTPQTEAPLTAPITVEQADNIRSPDGSKAFGNLARWVTAEAARLRKRIRVWNHAPDAYAWSASILPSIVLAHGLDSEYRYRLYFGWLAWGFDVGLFSTATGVLVHDGKGFTYVDPRDTGGPKRVETIDRDPLIEEFTPDEANERP